MFVKINLIQIFTLTRVLISILLILLTFVVASFYDYPSTFLNHDPDFRYWVNKNKVKKLTCSPKTYWTGFDTNYSTEYSYSEKGELIEERFYEEFIGDVSIDDTAALFDDGFVFFDTLGISHKGYFLKGDIIRKIQLTDANGNLVFYFFKDDEDDFDFYRAKILVKSIKYIDKKRDIEILNFGFMSYYAPYFDTLSSVKLLNDNKTNLISVTAWVKDPIEQDWYNGELRKVFSTERKRIDTLSGDKIIRLNNEFYNEKIIAHFGRNFPAVFKSCLVTAYFDTNANWFIRSRLPQLNLDDIKYSMQYAFSEERRFFFTNSDSSIIFHYRHSQIETVTKNEIGKLKRTYYLYGPISENPPELNGYFQYDKNGNLIEAYSLNCIGWNKTSYEYDGELIKKMTIYKEHMDSIVYRCERKKFLVRLPYGQSFYDDVIEFYSDVDYPPSLIYDTIKSEDYSQKSRISFVGNSRDTITNFIVADSSNRIYTVEYW